MTRLHGVEVPPRQGLPRGLRLFSVYAPLRQDPSQDAFVATFLDFVSGLDMQIPTLFLGDFNGTVCPDRDYSSGLAGVSPLLTRLLDLVGPWWICSLLFHLRNMPIPSTSVLGRRCALPDVTLLWAIVLCFRWWSVWLWLLGSWMEVILQWWSPCAATLIGLSIGAARCLSCPLFCGCPPEFFVKKMNGISW